MNLIFTARSQRKLADKGTEIEDSKFSPLEASVCTDNDGDASFLVTGFRELAGISVDLLKTMLVGLVTIFLGISPVHVDVVDFASFCPNCLVSRCLSVKTGIQTTLGSAIAQAVRHFFKLRSNFLLFVSGDILVLRYGFELSVTIHVTGEHDNSLALGVHDSSCGYGLLSLGTAHLSNTVAGAP
ncbi:hypothetical protein HG531_008155 [Fusarium graminearum]|nr:hypothetical protein HG531_008155 [Fusarium graminearum]